MIQFSFLKKAFFLEQFEKIGVIRIFRFLSFIKSKRKPQKNKTSDDQQINLLPWRRFYRQKKRVRASRGLFYFFALVVMGTIGVNLYFNFKINNLKEFNRKLNTVYLHQKEKNLEQASLNAWWKSSTKSHQQLKIFLQTFQESKTLEKNPIFFQEVRLDSGDSAHSMSWLGMTNPETLQAWLTRISSEIGGGEVQLVEIKKSLGQVQFEAQV
jgi:hypothetical protein